MENKAGSSNLGVVFSVRGSVVDIRFDGHLPPIYVLLHAQEAEIVVEVLAQLDARHVRGIALTPTQGLARGMPVEDTGGPLKTLVGKGILSRMFDVFGNAIDREAAPTNVQWRSVHRAPPSLGRRSTKSEVFETGIKVIDVLVSVRNAIGVTDLDKLREAVEREFLNLDEQEQSVRSVMAKLESGFIRRFAAFHHE